MVLTTSPRQYSQPIHQLNHHCRALKLILLVFSGQKIEGGVLSIIWRWLIQNTGLPIILYLVPDVHSQCVSEDNKLMKKYLLKCLIVMMGMIFPRNWKEPAPNLWPKITAEPKWPDDSGLTILNIFLCGSRPTWRRNGKMFEISFTRVNLATNVSCNRSQWMPARTKQKFFTKYFFFWFSNFYAYLSIGSTDTVPRYKPYFTTRWSDLIWNLKPGT